MENKNKKIIILVSILVIVVIAIVACILMFNKSNNSNQNNQNNSSNNPSENNKPNGNENNNSSNNENSGNNNGDNNNNNDNNNNDNNNKPNGSGNNSSNSTPTTTPKKLRIYSCRRTTTENDVEIVDSLSLRYHIENGLQSDEVIVTVKILGSTGNQTLEAYKDWMNQLKTLKGVSVTTTQSGDKTVFNIKTDYTKVDYSNIDFEDENRILFYNDIRANDTIETITEFLNEAGYTCQPPKEA